MYETLLPMMVIAMNQRSKYPDFMKLKLSEGIISLTLGAQEESRLFWQFWVVFLTYSD